MKRYETILVTGGAGYIGSVLTKNLVERGYKVKVLDSLIYGMNGIAHLIEEKSIDLINGDIRDQKTVEKSIDGVDCVVHLAGIVGEPLCSKIPEAAKQINQLATANLVNNCKNRVSRFIFSSTCSNYGSTNDIVNEETPLQTLSLYSETKVKSESTILSTKTLNFEPCILRFATAFGLSPRMRFDLLLQEFIRDASVNNKITIFGPEFWRPLVHVQDISNACVFAIEEEKDLISGQIYNVGDNSQNFTKIALANMIKMHMPKVEIEIQGTKKDPRNYRVSFDKIKTHLGFNITKTVDDGIVEILNEIKCGQLDPRESEFSNISKLTEKVKVIKV